MKLTINLVLKRILASANPDAALIHNVTARYRPKLK